MEGGRKWNAYDPAEYFELPLQTASSGGLLCTMLLRPRLSSRALVACQLAAVARDPLMQWVTGLIPAERVQNSCNKERN